MIRRRIAIALLTATLATSCSQSAISMGGYLQRPSAREAFSDPKVAALANAACRGNEAEVRRYVAEGAGPNSVGEDGVVPLLWAISCRSPQGVRALLQAGANPNQLIAGDFSPVYSSAQSSPSVLKILIEHGGDPNAGSIVTNRSALMESMSIGINGAGWDNYYFLLESGADINRVYGSFYTVAAYASDMAQYDKLRELIELGYSHDLNRLYSRMMAISIRKDLEPKREFVLNMLRQRGVTPPQSTHGRK